MITVEAVKFLTHVAKNPGQPLLSKRAMADLVGISPSSALKYREELHDQGYMTLDGDNATLTEKGRLELQAQDAANAVRSGQAIEPDAAPNIPLNYIGPSSRNPRKTFDKDALNDLAASIRDHSLIEPIVLRHFGAGLYEIVAGERRWRAMCINRDFMGGPDHLTPDQYRIIDVRDDAHQRVLALIENLQRVEIPPLEEAEAFDELARAGWTNARIADAIHKTTRHVELRRQLTANLIAPVREALAAEHINLAMARQLATVDEAIQAELLPKLMPETNDDGTTSHAYIQSAQQLETHIKWARADAERQADRDARMAEQAAQRQQAGEDGSGDDGPGDGDDENPDDDQHQEGHWDRHRRIGREFTQQLMDAFIAEATVNEALTLILLSLSEYSCDTDLGTLDHIDDVSAFNLNPSYDHSDLVHVFSADPDGGETKMQAAFIGALDGYAKVDPDDEPPITRLAQTLAAQLLRYSYPNTEGRPLAPFIVHLATRYGVAIPDEFMPATQEAAA